MQRGDALRGLSSSSHAADVIGLFRHSPGVVEHHSGQVFTGLGQVRHREAECGEQATLRGEKQKMSEGRQADCLT